MDEIYNGKAAMMKTNKDQVLGFMCYVLREVKRLRIKDLKLSLLPE